MEPPNCSHVTTVIVRCHTVTPLHVTTVAVTRVTLLHVTTVAVRCHTVTLLHVTTVVVTRVMFGQV